MAVCKYNAVIPIRGMIVVDAPTGLYREGGVSSEQIIRYINDADSNPSVKAILFDINSGGGTPVATDEIAQRIKTINKTNIAVIREVGASGAYWIASATDRIFANRMSITGSIGVIGSYLEIADLLDQYNITYRRLVSGEYKDMGSPFKEMTKDEENKYQAILDQMHEFFIEEVAANRNLDPDEVKDISDGSVFLGVEAKDLNLVDELGTKADAIAYLEKELNITASLYEYKEEMSIFDLFSMFSNPDFKIAKFINSHNEIPTIS